MAGVMTALWEKCFYCGEPIIRGMLADPDHPELLTPTWMSTTIHTGMTVGCIIRDAGHSLEPVPDLTDLDELQEWLA